MIFDNFLIAYKNIKERKTRVFLTLLGIAIGIMAIVSLMGIGQGMQQAISSELSSLSDTIIVFGGEINAGMGGGGFVDSGNKFLDRDIDSIQRIDGLRDVSPVYFGQAIITYNGITKPVSLVGMDPINMQNIFGIETLGLAQGEFMNEGEQFKCIVGHEVAYKIFDADMDIGRRIRINDNNFVVNGIYKRQGAGFSVPTDDNIHLTSYDFKKVTGIRDISGIIVRVYDVSNVESIAQEIEDVVNQNHGSDDFAQAITMASILESIQQVLGIIQIVLIAIASIALIVASIGIMNTMLTSVMERTHEIGIMKAIGARTTDVMTIFIVEGLLISLFGGISGVILGIVGAKGLSVILSGFIGGGMLNPSITLVSVILAVGVAMVVGIFSSLYPALKAAKMSPIEAVRYE
ncbi:MAG: ABC transporter permease [Thermoplasmatota archaeon]